MQSVEKVIIEEGEIVENIEEGEIVETLEEGEINEADLPRRSRRSRSREVRHSKRSRSRSVDEYTKEMKQILELYNYTSRHYKINVEGEHLSWGKINSQLRSSGFDALERPIQRKVERLDFALVSLAKVEDREVYRGMSGQQVFDIFSSFKVGDDFADKGFGSTSYNKDESLKFCVSSESQDQNFGVLIVMQGPKLGVDVLNYGLSRFYQNQAELLLIRNHKFQVKSVENITTKLGDYCRGVIGLISNKLVTLKVITVQSVHPLEDLQRSVLSSQTERQLNQRLRVFKDTTRSRGCTQDVLAGVLRQYDQERGYTSLKRDWCKCDNCHRRVSYRYKSERQKHRVHCAWACEGGA